MRIKGFTCRLTGDHAIYRVSARNNVLTSEHAHHDRHHCAQNADHLAHNTPFSAFFAEVVCTLGTSPPQPTASPPPNGGNCTIRRATRRRHAASQLLMVQKPPPQPASCATSPTRPVRRADWREKTHPAQPLHWHFREKTRPARRKNAEFGVF